MDPEGVLRTDHKISFVGLTILRLHYKMTPLGLPLQEGLVPMRLRNPRSHSEAISRGGRRLGQLWHGGEGGPRRLGIRRRLWGCRED
jgi:hypothetical protein